ncbi:DHA2 family efflux MFS transporter permease subunit [Pseudonocardia sp. CA-107938]|uniref:DHA2 family efflux MFS transporter permease subunit n=1 Tax=Pseudonocardia sp. CA-107938 TaxID=3240021 RepID=UPI003D8CDE3F
MSTAPSAAVAAPPDPASPYRWRWLALVAILGAEIMDLLDATVVGIAAPSIRADLGGDGATIQWIAAGYTLAFAVGLITGGRLGDLYGRRRMFLVGLVGFVVSSALCGFAGSPEMLITSRVLQGLFGALLIPQGFGIIKATFPETELPKVFGVFGPVMGLAAVAGPVVAGALIAWNPAGADWRTVFLINVPVGLAAFVLAAKVLPESRAEGSPRPDPLGFVLVSIGLALLVYPLVEGRELGWPTWTIAMMVVSVPVLAIFGVHQVRRSRAGRAPLVEPGLFRSRAFTGGLVLGLVLFGSLTGLAFALGLHLQLTLGFTPLQAGLVQAPWAFGIAVGATLAGAWLGPKLGRLCIQIGAVVTVAGIAGTIATFTATGAGLHGWELAPALLVTGIGVGMAMTPFFDITLAGVELDMVGSASGVLNANQQLGATAGTAVLGTVFFGLLEAGDAPGAVTVVLWLAAALMAGSVVLAWLLPRRAREEEVPV